MLTTNIEKEFVLECILSKVRCDGRQLCDYRKLGVIMFKERGRGGRMQAVSKCRLVEHAYLQG